MKFFTYFKGDKAEVTQDNYMEMVHTLGLITAEGFYPGSFRVNELSGEIEGYTVFTVSWWSDRISMENVAQLPFSFRVVSESLLTQRAKFSAHISAESPDAAKAILLHLLPGAEITRIK